MVPQPIINRKKHGFGVPIGRWFRKELKDYLPEILLSHESLNRGYFQPELLRQIIDEHQSGKCDRAHQLWSLLTLEIWHRIFIDQTADSHCYLEVSRNLNSPDYSFYP
jgi:asparagine synthase (glutamine-hydrolysing)